MEKSPKKLKFPKNLQGRALGRARVRGEGREGKSAQGRAPSPKKGSCALWMLPFLQTSNPVASTADTRYASAYGTTREEIGPVERL